MFVISCKFNRNFPHIIELVSSIRKYHLSDKIVVVDSNSEDKSYFDDLKKFDVLIEDVDNKNWMIGAYWHAYKKYPNEEFYFFMHDSMLVKADLTFLTKKDLTILMYFERNGVAHFNNWAKRINNETKYRYNNEKYGCYGPIFFCKKEIMQSLLENGVDKLLPNDKFETQICEGCYGFFFEEMGYNLKECSLYGNVFDNESPSGKSGLPPHKTDW